MLYLEEHYKTEVAFLFFKGLPTKIPDHFSDTARRSVPVIVVDIAGSSSLDLFQSIYVWAEEWVP